MKRLGPDLKMPSLKGGNVKMPPILSDLYWDLRDRRLLPVLALILVAIVAAPFLLSGGSSAVVPAGPAQVGGAAGSAAALPVVEAQPGLREYKKRLGRRKPTDPFKQRFTGPVLKGAHLKRGAGGAVTSTSTTTPESAMPSGGASIGGAGGESPPVEPAPSPPAETGGAGQNSGGHTGGAGGGTAGAPLPEGSRFFTYAIDVQITRIRTKKGGGKEESGPTTHKGLKPPSVLPGEKAPVVTYMGVSTKTRNPLFLVSPEVSSIGGEGKCVSGRGSCLLIELEPKFAETFVYGAGEVRYKVDVLKIEPVQLPKP